MSYLCAHCTISDYPSLRYCQDPNCSGRMLERQWSRRWANSMDELAFDKALEAEEAVKAAETAKAENKTNP